MECLWFCDFQFWSHQGSWIWDKRVVGTSITRLDGAIWWSFHVLGPNQQLTKVLLCWIKSLVASIVQSNSGVPAKARAGAVRIHGSIHTIKNIITSLNIINLKFTRMKTISQTKTIPFQMEHSYCKNMWNSKESQHFEFGKIESFLFGWKKPAHLYPMERRLSSRRIGKLFSQNWANLLRWIQNLKKEQLLDIFVFFPPSNGAGEGSSQLAKWFLACQNYLNACPDSLWHFLQDVEACPDDLWHFFTVDLTKFPYIAFV